MPRTISLLLCIAMIHGAICGPCPEGTIGYAGGNETYNLLTTCNFDKNAYSSNDATTGCECQSGPTTSQDCMIAFDNDTSTVYNMTDDDYRWMWFTFINIGSAYIDSIEFSNGIYAADHRSQYIARVAGSETLEQIHYIRCHLEGDAILNGTFVFRCNARGSLILIHKNTVNESARLSFGEISSIVGCSACPRGMKASPNRSTCIACAQGEPCEVLAEATWQPPDAPIIIPDAPITIATQAAQESSSVFNIVIPIICCIIALMTGLYLCRVYNSTGHWQRKKPAVISSHFNPQYGCL
ncbi:hypothetical protein GUITHDRAFT_148832 [Guillardia theta CCMP2712]|uniref:Uncharacterized protein n=1 Tax=Guillardia theta (strain CCMP2712) TaxID=905079 RepID=L1I773_GUITC|nr:hypothetical protein GUITHDRAFT_148832 [Guillardia theta CCMP2712]EKX32106.1 hypothetical protein GUITHDRAFT_148832 [Guillardia theta CCMP2712]|eukprot:XP_005819086.1 hypothetical protein GUITHDRAFT_148832 [Guillardia theta CCMP2712]